MRAGSDIDHVMSLITAKGYRMPESMFYLRLVHLLDRSKRKELMMIYAKDIALNKFSGKISQEIRPGLTYDLLATARKNFIVEPMEPAPSSTSMRPSDRRLPLAWRGERTQAAPPR